VARTEASAFPWGPSGRLCRIILQSQPNPTLETILYTISGVTVMDMTAGAREASQSSGAESIRPAASDTASRFAVQRNWTLLRASGIRHGSMAVRTHFVGNAGLLQPVLRQPRIGGLDRALDMIGGSREVIR